MQLRKMLLNSPVQHAFLTRMSADHPRWISNWGINSVQYSWEVNLFYWHMPCTCNRLDIWEVVLCLNLKTSDLKCGDFRSSTFPTSRRRSANSGPQIQSDS
ncbi:hypothetical protein RchiOBHm_Chr2g0090201 [Rosa chinensis]|uniref:Uncharacterized protein n=1 Tax=Rosa chinensis TaxID=74649 RepID=A0A2P6RJF1_ROSCH|nr:hypothetical protein RchiOBHm_Chr2g0090201 [Rosa chinensis]